MSASPLHWSVEEVPSLRGYAVEWVEPGRMILARRNRLFESGAAGAPRVPLGDVPAPAWKRFAASSRAAQRLLRFMFYNVLRLGDGSVFVTFDKEVGVFSGGRFHPATGLVRPFRVLRGGCALADDGSVYFGEYLDNPDRSEMRVYRFDPKARRAEIVHTFPPGAVRHIHGVYRDPWSNSLWCLTGDKPEECRMVRTDDRFRTLQEVGAGDETWRCVSLLFTAEAIYYAMDAEFHANRIFRMDRRSGSRTVVREIDGPVYYTAAAAQALFFAVTAELCPSQTSRSATLWVLDGSGECRSVASFPKDRLPVSYFLPGTLNFPCGPGLDGELLFSCVSLQKADDRTFRVRSVPR